MAEIERKIQSLTKKKLTLEEKFDKLESKSVCLGQYFQITQIELEKKVLLRQLCDVRIRLKNLNRQKVREKTRVTSFLSQVERSFQRIKEAGLDLHTGGLPGVEEDEAEVSLDDSFYTACEGDDLASDLDDELEEFDEQQTKPEVPVLPVLQLPGQRRDHENNIENDGESVLESQFEDDLSGSSSLMTPSPNRETEREIASWVRKHNNNIVQQVEKLTLMPTCAAVKVEDKSLSLSDNNNHEGISSSAMFTVIKKKENVVATTSLVISPSKDVKQEVVEKM